MTLYKVIRWVFHLLALVLLVYVDDRKSLVAFCLKAENNELKVFCIVCRLQRCRYGCMCPIHGHLARVAVLIFMAGLMYGGLWSVTGETALPGGNLFALSVLFVCCYVAGFLIGKIRLPPLLGENAAW